MMNSDFDLPAFLLSKLYDNMDWENGGHLRTLLPWPRTFAGTTVSTATRRKSMKSCGSSANRTPATKNDPPDDGWERVPSRNAPMEPALPGRVAGNPREPRS